LLADVLTAAAKRHLSSGWEFQARKLLEGRTKALSTAHICELIVAAAKGRADGTAAWLFDLPAGRLIERMQETVADLLLATAGHSVKVTEHLCQMRASKQLSAEQATGLLAAAGSVALATSSSSKQSCAQQSEPVLPSGAADSKHRRARLPLDVLAKRYSKTPIAEETLLHWLRSAVQCNSGSAIYALSRLNAARQLDAAHAAELLTAALHLGHAEAAEALASSFQAAEIASDKLYELLQSAVQQDSTAVVGALCRMDAAVQLEAAAVAGLFRAAVERQQCVTAAQLLFWFEQWQQQQEQQRLAPPWPAAPWVTKQQQHAMIEARPQKQPGQGDGKEQQQQQQAQQWSDLLGSAYVLALLMNAVQQCCCSALDVLRQLLDAATAVGLLQVAIGMGGSHESFQDMQVFETIVSLPALQQLEPQHTVDLLVHALRHDNTAAVKAINDCLPLAAELSAAQNAGQLLQLATPKGVVTANKGRHAWFAAVAVQLKRLSGAKHRQS
jgi:hypothetical protein